MYDIDGVRKQDMFNIQWKISKTSFYFTNNVPWVFSCVAQREHRLPPSPMKLTLTWGCTAVSAVSFFFAVQYAAGLLFLLPAAVVDVVPLSVSPASHLQNSTHGGKVITITGQEAQHLAKRAPLQFVSIGSHLRRKPFPPEPPVYGALISLLPFSGGVFYGQMCGIADGEEDGETSSEARGCYGYVAALKSHLLFWPQLFLATLVFWFSAMTYYLSVTLNPGFVEHPFSRAKEVLRARTWAQQDPNTVLVDGILQSGHSARMRSGPRSITPVQQLGNQKNSGEFSLHVRAERDASDSDINKERSVSDYGMNWCAHCGQVKPLRTHHCRICARCVLVMDHHCPWINNCVGYYNRKPFVQFLWSSFLLLIYLAVLLLFALRNSFNVAARRRNHIALLVMLMLWFVAVLSLVVFLGSMAIVQTNFLRQNVTTVENQQSRRWGDNRRRAKMTSSSSKLAPVIPGRSQLLSGTRESAPDLADGSFRSVPFSPPPSFDRGSWWLNMCFVLGPTLFEWVSLTPVPPFDESSQHLLTKSSDLFAPKTSDQIA